MSSLHGLYLQRLFPDDKGTWGERSSSGYRSRVQGDGIVQGPPLVLACDGRFLRLTPARRASSFLMCGRYDLFLRLELNAERSLAYIPMLVRMKLDAPWRQAVAGAMESVAGV